MSKTLGIVIGLALLFGIVGFSYFSMMMNYRNEEAVLRVQIDKQTQVDQIRFDNTWKIIKDKAQVADKYKDAFKDIYTSIMTGRYGANGRQEGGFMNILQESNPKFDESMYHELMTTIESERKGFERDQKTLIALSEQHEILIKTFPSSFFLSDVQPIEIKLVTSTKTNKAFDTGVDDDVDVFDKPDTTKRK
jgi:hypothetical protein